MILSMSEQAKLFLFTVGIGFLLGVIYDIFRILRKSFNHTDFMTNIEDIVYWLLVTFVMFYFMLNKNYGEIRFFTIIGAFAGMVIYFLTVSRFILSVCVAVVDFLKKVVAAAIKIILMPVRLIINILKIPVVLIINIGKKLLFPAKKFLQKSRRYVKIKSKRLKKELDIMFKKV